MYSSQNRHNSTYHKLSIRWTGLRTGLRDKTHRKLCSSDFEAEQTLLHYSILTAHELNSGQMAITWIQHH